MNIVKSEYVWRECVERVLVSRWGSLIIYAYYGGVFSRWCRCFGHFGVGLYCMVLGGMVRIMCMSVWLMGRDFSLWLSMTIIVAL